MEFRVLGAIEVEVDGEMRSVSSSKQRELLALMLINPNTALSSDRIMDELWGDDPPSIGTLRFHVSKLRSILGGERSPITTTDNGYRLDLDPNSIDAVQFEAAIVAAGAALGSDIEAATIHIEHAAELWRGGPYPGIEYRPFGEIEIRRLNELYLTFLARRMEIELAQGRHDEAVAGLEELVNKHPLHERFWELLMLALYRSGRQADALRAYQRAQQVLGEELGITPSTALSDLEENILLQAPALSYVADAPSNLPRHVSTFVGRVEDLGRLQELVLGERMVTLTGPGGIGKTRLAVELGHAVAQRFPGGAWFCDLAGTESEGVVRSIVGALPIEEEAAEDPLATIVEWATDRAALLVVDNCEHLVGEVGDVVFQIALRCPQLHVVATSRERLGVDGEYVWALDGLRLPETGSDVESVRASEAVQLLVDRARRADQTFLPRDLEIRQIAELVVVLDGIPLAIELAAARLRSATVDDVLDQIRADMTALGDRKRRGPARHRTMRTALEWSYRLLDGESAAVWRKLAVFRGGFTPAAVAAVVGTPAQAALDHLVDTSLIKVVRDSAVTRYRMLEVVRAYAESLLTEEEVAEAVQAHVGHFVGEAEENRQAFGGAGQAIALQWFEVDLPNLRVALRRARLDENRPSELRLVSSLGRFWFDTGRHAEGLEELNLSLASRDDEPSTELAKAIEELVQLYAWAGSIRTARELIKEQARVASHLDTDVATSRVLASEGVTYFAEGNYRESSAAFAAMVPLLTPIDGDSLPFVFASLAFLNLWMGNREEAESAFSHSMAWARRLGVSEGEAIRCDYGGWRSFYDGDHEHAVTSWEAAEAEYAALGQRTWVIEVQQLQAWVRALDGDDTVLAMLRSATDEAMGVGLRSLVARGRVLEAAYGESHEPAGVALVDAAELAMKAGGWVWTFWALWHGARAASQKGLHEVSRALRSTAEILRKAVPYTLPAGLNELDMQLQEELGSIPSVAGCVDDIDAKQVQSLLRKASSH
ncbi:MAG: BTAD domain-containing putative transcriptional regulator [Acidimicrobiia bacterium]|nr:BTAD domain-containing putative transcriptional regulator [Acidimicrobiia bacterium]